MGTTNDKAARRVKVEDGLLIKVVLWDDRLNDMLLEVCSNLVIGDSLIVLGGDEDSVNANRNHGTIFIIILDSYLGLTIRP
ncbi:hypothetical protein RHGRI_035475 [Rhododendron griersonianum]|uniref:Uncharacterized protein n=1 Tax=Rhododendron griersonianum TaxID=479676 RepID=A0AAV6HJA0_9ERIC|nr:hypothetical protein RHGRI_035475 [Rhododendron griersonianum]